MSEHTPGPWRIEKQQDELLHSRMHVIGERPTVSIWAAGKYASGGFYHEIALVADNDFANARLIAAAPELLQMVECLMKPIGALPPEKFPAAVALYAQAMLLIAKARGDAVQP
jgi:hypothetical protein